MTQRPRPFLKAGQGNINPTSRKSAIAPPISTLTKEMKSVRPRPRRSFGPAASRPAKSGPPAPPSTACSTIHRPSTLISNTSARLKRRGASAGGGGAVSGMSAAPAQAAVEARDQRLRRRGKGDVDDADHAVEKDLVAGAGGREIARMHQLAARDGRYQGRLLQHRKPEIGKSRQTKSEQFRQQDEALGRPAADGKRPGRLQIGAVEG